jgi:DNA invertase Pin-like site-specific DNA recombinase
MKGPRLTGVSRSSPEGWKAEVVTTLSAIQEVRQACDNTEVRTVRYARKAGFSWAEIATALGVSRQAVWERWHELDETLPKNDAWGPAALIDLEPGSTAAPDSKTA